MARSMIRAPVLDDLSFTRKEENVLRYRKRKRFLTVFCKIHCGLRHMYDDNDY